MRKFIHRAMLFLLLLELLLPFFNLKGVSAASSIKLYYNFEQGSYTTSPVASQYSSSQAKTFTKDISSLVVGTITGVTLSNQGGTSGTASFTDNSVTITSLSGGNTTVYGKSVTKPMHQIYRQPNGKIWEHKGSKTVPVEFDGAGGNPSPYPGKIPLYGRLRYLTTSFNYSDVNSFGTDLRYSYDSPLYYKDGQTAINGHVASGDLVKDYLKEGAAVTTA
ncbi:hypothetical protein AB4Z22_36610, partial [Paenibacillus sp. TAF58]